MRNRLIVLWMLLASITPAAAQLSVGIGLPGVSIGFNLPVYPQLVPVPGYPVYYAPQVNSNYFFYDGMYWVYQRDNWYASSWYNGPWGLLSPEAVPLFILRVPVRYYRQPPVYFRGWRSDAPPRWDEHWGNSWAQQRRGWDNWNHSSVPSPAPLPSYQRQYSGNRYPHPEQQQGLESQYYRYQPHDAVVQQHYQAQRVQGASAPYQQQAPAPYQQGRQGVPQERNYPQQDPCTSNRPPSPPQGTPPGQHAQSPQKGNEHVQGSGGGAAPAQQRGSSAEHQKDRPPESSAQHEPQTSRSQGQDKKSHGD